MKLADAQTQIEKLIERGEPFERVETAIERLDRPDAEKAALCERTLAQAGHTQDVLNTRIDPDLGAEIFVPEPADELGQLEEADSTDAQG